MSPWKVILATLAIFCTGLITGAMLVRPRPSPAAKQTGSNAVLQPGPLRAEFVQRMSEELNLTPEQKTRILTLVRESQERNKLIYGLISDDLREEMRLTREAIRRELTADQVPKFEQILKRRARIIEALRGDQNDGGPPRFRQRPFLNRQNTDPAPARGADPAPTPGK